MRKIPTVFQRDQGDHFVKDEVTPGCEWVIAGEGVATVKYDGTACLWRDGDLYKRYTLKADQNPPYGFVPAQEADPVTGQTPGWMIVGEGPSDKYHREALQNRIDLDGPPKPGTYELVGPRIQDNPYGLSVVVLWSHDAATVVAAPRDYEGLGFFLAQNVIEGLVFKHPDGRMAKIKRRDYGLQWPLKPAGRR